MLANRPPDEAVVKDGVFFHYAEMYSYYVCCHCLFSVALNLFQWMVWQTIQANKLKQRIRGRRRPPKSFLLHGVPKQTHHLETDCHEKWSARKRARVVNKLLRTTPSLYIKCHTCRSSASTPLVTIPLVTVTA